MTTAAGEHPSVRCFTELLLDPDISLNQSLRVPYQNRCVISPRDVGQGRAWAFFQPYAKVPHKNGVDHGTKLNVSQVYGEPCKYHCRCQGCSEEAPVHMCVITISHMSKAKGTVKKLVPSEERVGIYGNDIGLEILGARIAKAAAGEDDEEWTETRLLCEDCGMGEDGNLRRILELEHAETLRDFGKPEPENIQYKKWTDGMTRLLDGEKRGWSWGESSKALPIDKIRVGCVLVRALSRSNSRDKALAREEWDKCLLLQPRPQEYDHSEEQISYTEDFWRKLPSLWYAGKKARLDVYQAGYSSDRDFCTHHAKCFKCGGHPSYIIVATQWNFSQLVGNTPRDEQSTACITCEDHFQKVLADAKGYEGAAVVSGIVKGILTLGTDT